MRPERNAYRDALALDGFWAASSADGIEADGLGLVPGFAAGGLVAVPGSINEQWAERGLRDSLGPFWLQRQIVVPRCAAGMQARLQFASADLTARVWWDGRLLGRNDAPFLPFAFDLGELQPGAVHILTVCLDSRLPTDHPLPGIESADFAREGRSKDEVYPPVRYDFFPYTGLHRTPHLCFLPKQHLGAPRIEAGYEHGGTLRVRTRFAGLGRVVLSLLDGESALVRVASDDGDFDLSALAVEPWSPASPKRYRLRLELKRDVETLDEINRDIGFRDVRIDQGRLLLNGESVQIKGFGLHEDFPVLGKGQALAVTVKDLELLRWCGGNSFRTSHYPYAEETLDLADALGLLVISECASVNLDFRRTTDATLEQHIAHIERLIERDHWHPSVIAWSLTNEPGYLAEAEYKRAAPGYFAELFAAARVLDSTRPFTAANVGSRHGLIDPLYAHCDFLSLNRYLGWYENPAQLDFAIARLRDEFDALAAAFPDKPIFVSEFGADAVAGMHSSTDQLFSEEYQSELIARYWDLIANHRHCIGGHVWNLVDFKTAQNFRRVVLNHKGVFTRSRDPKMAAWRVRGMWR